GAGGVRVGLMGVLVGGFGGGGVAALATFLPCYSFVVIAAPYFKKHGKRPGIVAFVNGVTAAAVGAICGAVIVLGRRTIFEQGWQPEVPKVLLVVVTIGLLSSGKRIPEPLIVLGAAIIGLGLYPFVR